MTEHNIPDYCYTEEGDIYLLASINGLVVTGYKSEDRKAYWVMLKNSKQGQPQLMVTESVYKQLYDAIKERDRLIREWLNNKID